MDKKPILIAKDDPPDTSTYEEGAEPVEIKRERLKPVTISFYDLSGEMSLNESK